VLLLFIFSLYSYLVVGSGVEEGIGREEPRLERGDSIGLSRPRLNAKEER
jgi:hypothetical protein